MDAKKATDLDITKRLDKIDYNIAEQLKKQQDNDAQLDKNDNSEEVNGGFTSLNVK